MFIAIFFISVVLLSLSLVTYIILHGVKNKMITYIFAMVLISCAAAASTWTIVMILEKVPAMVSTT